MKMLGQPANDAEKLLEASLRRLDKHAPDGLRYEPISGGITNANYRVVSGAPARVMFVKIPGKGTEAFIDRKVANEAAVLASDLALGPRVLHFFEDTGVEVSEFVEGYRTCSNFDFQTRQVRDMAIDCYRTFHNGKLLSQTKTVFDMIDEHIQQAVDLDGLFPDDWAWLDRQYRLARAALEASGLDITPCFNDPMPGNFMLNAKSDRMLLIDYEYASNNDRCYELGIWFGEMFFEEDVESELIERYFGEVREEVIARCQVYKALADIKWGCWSIVQARQSDLAFDYSKYGAWKFLRARSVMNDWRWQAWLRKV
jgi:thiamine kinase-like enzyme